MRYISAIALVGVLSSCSSESAAPASENTNTEDGGDGAALATEGGHGDARSADSSPTETGFSDGARADTGHPGANDASTPDTAASDAPGAADGPASADAPAADGGRLSGLLWNSGAGTEDPDAFATWRGHPLDYYETWPNRGNWNEIRNPDIYGAVSAFAGKGGHLEIGIAMLPEDSSGTFATCATGAYDQYYNDVGAKLDSLGRGDADVRLGWEANGDWYAWSIGTSIADYIGCFRKEAAAIRTKAPGIVIDWNMNKDSHMGSGNVIDAYPGDAYVDVIGVDFYDNYPAYPDQNAWDNDYNATQNGGPRGLGQWLAFAKMHGKPFSVPEWGVEDDGGGGGGFDNPFYVQKMFEFFQTNAANIAYECYFNLGDAGVFMIYPESNNPNAAAAYKSRF